MALNDNSKERIKFACKELEEALSVFEQAKDDPSTSKAVVVNGTENIHRAEKIHEITRQLRDIRQQLDSLS